MFCKNSDENTNTLPPFIPKLAIIAEIVYPTEKPLYNITKHIKKLPIILEPEYPN